MTKQPLHILSLGAGVQSSTLALMAAGGEVTPMPACAIFADTQDEPASVYRWLDWLEKQLPFPVYRMSRGSLGDDSLKLKKTKDGRLFSTTNIPFFTRNADGSLGKIRHRGCTRDYKLLPIFKKCREIAGKDALLEFRREARRLKKQDLPPPIASDCSVDRDFTG